jgi:hypothetical protein
MCPILAALRGQEQVKRGQDPREDKVFIATRNAPLQINRVMIKEVVTSPCLEVFMVEHCQGEQIFTGIEPDGQHLRLTVHYSSWLLFEYILK